MTPCTIYERKEIISRMNAHINSSIFHLKVAYKVGITLTPQVWALCSDFLRGASGRHSARGKGHEEGGWTYAKAGSSLRSPPGNSRASTPQNQSLPTLLLCALTYTSDFTRGCPPPPLSEKELT